MTWTPRERGRPVAKAGVIGLDIGATCVRAAEVSKSSANGSATLTRYAEVPLPLGTVRDGEVEDAATVSAAIRQLWSVGKFATRDVNIGVGNQRVIVRELDLPWLPLAQLKQSLPFQVGELLPMPADEALLDFLPTAEVDGPQGRMLHGMLVAATRDTVRANILAVESAGLRPQMVDLSSFALLRALIGGEAATKTVAVVEIGAQITQVVVVASGAPRFVRILPFGGNHTTEAVARELSVSFQEAEDLKRKVGLGMEVPGELQAVGNAVLETARPLVESIRNTFVYYASNNPGAAVDLVVLAGGGAMLPGLGQYLASASRIPVSVGDALSTVRRGKHLVLGDHGRVAAVPVGLAKAVAA
ncbi:type IV pilus assembly protein PilM [Isoptericola sp. b490]|nr:type IV pilus assembly protein PilM [Isoptericola sp. b490]